MGRAQGFRKWDLEAFKREFVQKKTVGNMLGEENGNGSSRKRFSTADESEEEEEWFERPAYQSQALRHDQSGKSELPQELWQTKEEEEEEEEEEENDWFGPR
jgi:hypothetical protein